MCQKSYRLHSCLPSVVRPILNCKWENGSTSKHVGLPPHVRLDCRSVGLAEGGPPHLTLPSRTCGIREAQYCPFPPPVSIPRRLGRRARPFQDRKSTRLNSSHRCI